MMRRATRQPSTSTRKQRRTTELAMRRVVKKSLADPETQRTAFVEALNALGLLRRVWAAIRLVRGQL